MSAVSKAEGPPPPLSSFPCRQHGRRPARALAAASSSVKGCQLTTVAGHGSILQHLSRSSPRCSALRHQAQHHRQEVAQSFLCTWRDPNQYSSEATGLCNGRGWQVRCQVLCGGVQQPNSLWVEATDTLAAMP